MKRPSLERETNMSPPVAKRVCTQTTQNAPADPATPTDDFDDIYDDSPAISKYREESAPRSGENVTVKQSNPSLHPGPFLLPGLGLYSTKDTDTEQEINGGNGLSPGSTVPLPPVGELQVTQSLSRTEGKSPLDNTTTRQVIQSRQLDERSRIDPHSLDRLYLSRGSDATAVPVFEASPTKEPAAEEQQRVEKSNFAATSRVVDQSHPAELPNVDHSPTEIQTAQWVNRAAGEVISDTAKNEQSQHDHVGTTTSKDTEKPSLEQSEGVIPIAQQRNHGLHRASGSSTDPKKIVEVTLDEYEESQRDGNGIGASNTGPTLSTEDQSVLAGQASTDPISREYTAEQRTDERTPQIMRDNVEEDPRQDIDTSMVLSSNIDFPQAALRPQIEPTELAGAEKAGMFGESAEANKHDGEAEFELDSSPIESSSESDVSASSSSGDSDYEMLDPEEEARRLMQEDGGSDDEGKGGKAPGPLRTLNENPDEVIPKPQVEITPDMVVSELGSVEHVVENSILIKGKTSGETRALESGSLLCLGDTRSVIGVIAELLGQVQQPYYSVRFTNPAAIAEAGISKGTPIFYVEEHSSYVFTQSLKVLKGSDASNMHDEEVGDDELEFSDDEAEAEHKRRAKQERQGRRGDREERSDRGGRGGRTDRGARNDRGGRGNRSDGFTKGPRGGHMRGGARGHFNQPDARDTSSPMMNYDDNDDGEDLYTPLARPSNLHEIMGRGEAPQDNLKSHLSGNPGSQGFHRGGRPDRGSGRVDRGRGDRGQQGRGGRGNRSNINGFNGDSQNGQYDSQEQHFPNQNSPRHGNNYPSLAPPANGTSAPPMNGWPNHFAPYPSSHSFPSYQSLLYIPPQQNYAPYPSNTYNPAHSPSQYPYLPQQNPPPPTYNHQHNPYQPSSPTTPVPPTIPAGAHINPAFFSPTGQQPPQPWQQR
ncbi:MAG: hypothetical protein Q9178_004008 [Gyalolechia marmorata]